MKTLLTIAISLSALCSSRAAITYVNPVPNISIPTSFGGVYLDLITAGETAPTQGGNADPSGDSYTVSLSQPPSGDWDINFFFGGAGIAHNASLQPYRASETDQLSAVDNLTIGTVLNGDPLSPEPATGPSAPLSVADFGGSGSGNGGGSGISTSGNHMGSDADQFTGGTSGYIGFVLDPGTANEQFGWIGVTLYDDGTPGVIHDWAYSPEPIEVGAIPEPASTPLIALIFLLAIRRRR